MNEEIIESIKKLVKEFPNDSDLGREVRKLLNEVKKPIIEGIWDSTNGY